MDAVKFFKTANRLCKNQGCNVCPVAKEGCCMVGFDDDSVKNIEETISKVEQWAKDHPVKTRQSEFLKRFPNAKLDSNGVLAIRPCDIDSKCCTDDNYLIKCGTCAKDYWLTEVPNND
jgi:hypothetical protein|nr:MAG TPA: hypothetical protein [Caudoviricetes sp.]